MSDHYVCFIPADAEFVPNEKAQTAAAALIQKTWHHDLSEITLETDEHILFRDCGENFESVHCPYCSTELDLENWQDLMEQDYSNEHGFRLKTMPLPCCGRGSNLNELTYKWPMGFSRFILCTEDPGRDTSQSILTKLELALGCELRIIHRMC